MKHHSKETWNTWKEKRNYQENGFQTRSSIVHDDVKITIAKIIAGKFNEYFTEVGAKFDRSIATANKVSFNFFLTPRGRPRLILLTKHRMTHIQRRGLRSWVVAMTFFGVTRGVRKKLNETLFAVAIDLSNLAPTSVKYSLNLPAIILAIVILTIRPIIRSCTVSKSRHRRMVFENGPIYLTPFNDFRAWVNHYLPWYSMALNNPFMS